MHTIDTPNKSHHVSQTLCRKCIYKDITGVTFRWGFVSEYTSIIYGGVKYVKWSERKQCSYSEI